MNSNMIAIVIVFLLLGLVFYTGIRSFIPYKEKKKELEALLYVIGFAPMILSSFLHIDNDRIENAIYAFCVAFIISNYFYPKWKQFKNKIIQNIKGNDQKYKDIEKVKQKQKAEKKSKKHYKK